MSARLPGSPGRVSRLAPLLPPSPCGWAIGARGGQRFAGRVPPPRHRWRSPSEPGDRDGGRPPDPGVADHLGFTKLMLFRHGWRDVSGSLPSLAVFPPVLRREHRLCAPCGRTKSKWLMGSDRQRRIQRDVLLVATPGALRRRTVLGARQRLPAFRAGIVLAILASGLFGFAAFVTYAGSWSSWAASSRCTCSLPRRWRTLAPRSASSGPAARLLRCPSTGCWAWTCSPPTGVRHYGRSGRLRRGTSFLDYLWRTERPRRWRGRRARRIPPAGPGGSGGRPAARNRVGADHPCAVGRLICGSISTRSVAYGRLAPGGLCALLVGWVAARSSRSPLAPGHGPPHGPAPSPSPCSMRAPPGRSSAGSMRGPSWR